VLLKKTNRSHQHKSITLTYNPSAGSFRYNSNPLYLLYLLYNLLPNQIWTCL